MRYLLPALLLTPTLALADTLVEINSSPGAVIGAGQYYQYDHNNANIEVISEAWSSSAADINNPLVSARFIIKGYHQDGTSADRWSLDIQHMPIKPGVYPITALGAPSAGAVNFDLTHLSETFEGTDCIFKSDDTSYGNVTVKSVAISDTDTTKVASLDVDFAVNCLGQHGTPGPVVTGSAKLNTSLAGQQETVGGLVHGLNNYRLICQNITTKQKGSKLLKRATKVDCSETNFRANKGDKVRISVVGTVK